MLRKLQSYKHAFGGSFGQRTVFSAVEYFRNIAFRNFGYFDI